MPTSDKVPYNYMYIQRESFRHHALSNTSGMLSRSFKAVYPYICIVTPNTQFSAVADDDDYVYNIIGIQACLYGSTPTYKQINMQIRPVP